MEPLDNPRWIKIIAAWIGCLGLIYPHVASALPLPPNVGGYPIQPIDLNNLIVPAADVDPLVKKYLSSAARSCDLEPHSARAMMRRNEHDGWPFFSWGWPSYVRQLIDGQGRAIVAEGYSRFASKSDPPSSGFLNVSMFIEEDIQIGAKGNKRTISCNFRAAPAGEEELTDFVKAFYKERLTPLPKIDGNTINSWKLAPLKGSLWSKDASITLRIGYEKNSTTALLNIFAEEPISRLPSIVDDVESWNNVRPKPGVKPPPDVFPVD